MNDLLTLEGRVALITGAGQGIGRQIALHFAAHKAAGVVVNDYVLERAEAVAEEVKQAGGNAIALQGDVTDFAACKEVIARAHAVFGSVDILVNNAGSAGANPSPDARKPFWETGPEAWNSFIDVNFYGVLNCTSAVIPGMIERKRGRIITIISDAGRMGDSGLEVYAGAKAGELQGGGKAVQAATDHDGIVTRDGGAAGHGVASSTSRVARSPRVTGFSGGRTWKKPTSAALLLRLRARRCATV